MNASIILCRVVGIFIGTYTLLGSAQVMLAVGVSEMGPCSYLGLPFHSCHRDAQEKDYCDGADDSDIVDFICHDGIYTLRDKTRSSSME